MTTTMTQEKSGRFKTPGAHARVLRKHFLPLGRTTIRHSRHHLSHQFLLCPPSDKSTCTFPSSQIFFPPSFPFHPLSPIHLDLSPYRLERLRSSPSTRIRTPPSIHPHGHPSSSTMPRHPHPTSISQISVRYNHLMRIMHISSTTPCHTSLHPP